MRTRGCKGWLSFAIAKIQDTIRTEVSLSLWSDTSKAIEVVLFCLDDVDILICRVDLPFFPHGPILIKAPFEVLFRFLAYPVTCRS